MNEERVTTAEYRAWQAIINEEEHHDIWYEGGRRITTPEYRSWQAMRNRCLNPNAQDFRYYSGRSITPHWDDYRNFLADMGRKPTPEHTLERADNARGYCPCNCYWATRQTQARNRDYCKLNVDKARRIRGLYDEGFTQQEIADRYGVSQTTISLIIRGVTWA